MWFKVFNVIGFQAMWITTVYCAGRGLDWVGPIVAAVFVCSTLFFSPNAKADLRMLAIALPIGFIIDSLFAASGWLNYSHDLPWTNIAPLWIIGMWAGFALTLNHSLGFLASQPWAAALFGLIGGPFAYWVAAKSFNALSMSGPSLLHVLGALALAWAIVLPFLYIASGRMQNLQVART